MFKGSKHAGVLQILLHNCVQHGVEHCVQLICVGGARLVDVQLLLIAVQLLELSPQIMHALLVVESA